MTLQTKYRKETAVLKNLFGADTLTPAVWRRLNRIHNATEGFWRNQIKLKSDVDVKYLLIAEAPPWSEKGIVQYVYNPKSDSRTFLKAVLDAFGIEDANDKKGRIQLLEDLRQKGFLLCDSLPFAMNYSEKNKRNRKGYRELVSMTACSYLQAKINESGIKWHKDLRIAFGVRLNARPLIGHLNGELTVGSRKYTINEDMVAVSKANYPHAGQLKTVFKL